jgi:ABC-type nickel/cobalt efflux system permease component RcnA
VLGLDDRLAALGTGGSIVLAITVAVLLGLRHATDPDHLTAVSALVLGGNRGGARHAGRLGFAWGLGHATTLIVVGLPVVLLHSVLPDIVQRAAELAVGAIIVALALRLLRRWRHGVFHAHAHEHDGVRHAHPHVHEHGTERHEQHEAHRHAHPESLGRTPRTAFGIGLVHGLGGSAGVGLLLIGAMPDHTVAAVALVLFAGATALSMSLASAAWGLALASRAIERRLAALAPVFGTASLAFGLWYGALAVS